MNSPLGPAAVTFDVWYTLLYLTPQARLHYEAARRSIWSEALERVGFPAGAARRRVRALEVEAHRRERGGKAFTLLDQRRWVAGGRSVPSARVDQLLGRAFEKVDARLTPGALPLLDRLRDRGIRLGLVSNVLHEPPGASRRVLVRTGIADRVDTIVLSSEVGSAKPSGRPMRLALRRLGIRPSQALHLGDTSYDILSAWAAGVPAARYVGVRRSWPLSTRRGIGLMRWRVPVVRRWDELPRSLPALWARARHAAERGLQARA